MELKNPHLTGLISVTKVKTTPDLKYARVYVTMINEKSKKENLSILKKSSGYIRSAIAKKINLRNTPELIFEFDDSLVGVINYVVVRHWMGRGKRLIEGEAKNQELIDKYGEKKRVVYDPKAKTEEQAKEIAEKKLKEWSRMVVTAEQVRLPCAPYMDAVGLMGSIILSVFGINIINRRVGLASVI